MSQRNTPNKQNKSIEQIYDEISKESKSGSRADSEQIQIDSRLSQYTHEPRIIISERLVKDSLPPELKESDDPSGNP